MKEVNDTYLESLEHLEEAENELNEFFTNSDFVPQAPNGNNAMEVNEDLQEAYQMSTVIGQLQHSEIGSFINYDDKKGRIVEFYEPLLKSYLVEKGMYYESAELKTGMTYNPEQKTWITENTTESLISLIEKIFVAQTPLLLPNLKQKDFENFAKMVVQETKARYNKDDFMGAESNEQYLVGLPDKMTYDFRDNTIRESVQRDYIIERTTYMPIQHDWKNETNEISEWLEFLVGDSATTIEQYIGYAFSRTNKPCQAFMIMTDDKNDINSKSGGNGKSSVISLIQSMFSRSMQTVFETSDLTDGKNKFAQSQFYTKQLAVDSDMELPYIKNSGALKRLTGGDNVKGEFKGKDAFQFNAYCKIIISTNTLPRFADNTDGFQRRLAPVAFKRNFIDVNSYDAKYSKEHFPNYHSYTKDNELMGKFMWRCIQQYRELWFKDGKEVSEKIDLYQSETSKALLQLWNDDNDSLSEFVEDNFEFTGDENDKINITAIRELYFKYCEDLRIKDPISVKNLPKQLRKSFMHKFENCNPEYKVIKFEGKSTRGFMGFKFKLED